METAVDFSVVYGRWMPELTRYCRRILNSDADAEDAAQNAMLKAMAALESGPAPREMAPWLHRIARNEAISLFRRRTGGAELDEAQHPTGPAPDEVVGVKHRLAELLGDVQALPERQREALVLRELDGLSYRAVATRLGITEAAAQQAVLDARTSLQDFDAGRALACEGVQRWMSTHEHARLRTRRVRAHLRGCAGCRGFSHALGTRPRELALVLPAITGAGLVGRLLALLGGGSTASKAVVAAGVLATAGGLGLVDRAFDDPGSSVAPPARVAPEDGFGRFGAFPAARPTPSAGAAAPGAAAATSRGARGRPTSPARDGLVRAGAVTSTAVPIPRGSGAARPAATPAPAARERTPSTPTAGRSARAAEPAPQAQAPTVPRTPRIPTPAVAAPIAPAVEAVQATGDAAVAEAARATEEVTRTVTETTKPVTDAAQGLLPRP